MDAAVSSVRIFYKNRGMEGKEKNSGRKFAGENRTTEVSTWVK